MITVEVVFEAQDNMTPDLAAKLSQTASHYAATVYLSRGKVRLCVDSLISIIALDLRRGCKVTISAEGEEAQSAVDAMAVLLEGAR